MQLWDYPDAELQDDRQSGQEQPTAQRSTHRRSLEVVWLPIRCRRSH